MRLENYDTGYPDPRGTRGLWRVGWRGMAATTGFRTLYPALIPPRATHTHAVFSVASHTSNLDTVWAGAVMSALSTDFLVRSVTGSNIRMGLIESLPSPPITDLAHFAIRKFLQLNCITEVYAPLWEELTGEDWTMQSAIRRDLARRQAQADIDVIVAMLLNLTVEELRMIYRTHFPVMRRYDGEDLYGQEGRKAPKAVAKAWRELGEGESLPHSQLVYTHGQSGKHYQLTPPLAPFDYEAHVTRAWDTYSRVLITRAKEVSHGFPDAA